jgi:hypothetical protein
MDSRYLNMIRIIIPYINSNIRPHVLAIISFLELKFSINSISIPLKHAFNNNEPIISDVDEVLRKLKEFSSPDESKMIEQLSMIINMMDMMKLMQETGGMEDIFNMFGGDVGLQNNDGDLDK